MKRWTISNVLLATALVACIFMFPQTEGCGWHVARLNDLAVSPDGKVLAVSRFDGRIHEGRVSDCWQTVSLVQADSGQNQVVLSNPSHFLEHQELKRPQIGSSWLQFTGARLYVRESHLGVWVFDHAGHELAKNRSNLGLTNFAVTPDDTWILQNDLNGKLAMMLATEDSSQLWSIPIQHSPFFQVDGLKLSQDLCVVMDLESVRVLKWNGLATIYKKTLGERHGRAYTAQLGRRNSLLFVAFEEGYGTVELATQIKLWSYDQFLHLSPDGRYLVTRASDEIAITDLENDTRLNSLKIAGDRVCTSPDGQRLYVADGPRLSCYEIEGGTLVWSSYMPGRYRPSFVWPLMALLLCLAWWWRTWTARANQPSRDATINSASGQT